MSMIETQEIIPSKNQGSILSRLGNWLFKHHPSVNEIGDRRRAQLMAGISLVLVVSLLLGLIIRGLTLEPSEHMAAETFQIGGLVLFSLLAYILSRTPNFQWGSYTLVTAFSIGAIINALESGSVSDALSFIIPAFVIGSALLRPREITVLVVIDVTILFLLPIFSPTIDPSFPKTGIVITTGLLLIVVVVVRNLIERERLAEVESVNRALRELKSSLEQRVVDATRDLELAAEVSRQVSMLRDLDTMLAQAVDRIRDRFDLYYTQVYLTDPTERTLILRAGTGEVGQTLINRGHRLPIDLSSLNGIAATERRTVIVGDTETNPLHRANPLLPDTRSEMVVPMLVGKRMVGVIDMQSSKPRALSDENLTAFETLAGQMAISITNAELFAETEQANAFAEEQSRRLTREGWHEFLDAIERSERIAYAYDRKNITPLHTPINEVQEEDTLITPIRVSGVQVGKMHFQRDEPWTEDDYITTSAVAQQVAQQIENLRLLAQAEQYQAKAQEALQRMTREGWKEYQDQFATQAGFVYQDREVTPLNGQSSGFEDALKYEIKVRNESIGELAIAGPKALSEEDSELVTYINEQLSTHIENLRLSTQTQIALARTDELYGISQSLNQASTEAEILEALTKPATEAGAGSAILMYLDMDKNGNPEWTEIVAVWQDDESAPNLGPVGTRFYLPDLPLAKLWVNDPDNPILISDIFSDKRVDDLSRSIMQQSGSKALSIIPLTRGQDRVGLLIFNWEEVHQFNKNEKEIFRAIIELASPAVQNRRLFDQIQNALNDAQTFRQLAEASGQGIGMATMDGNLAYVNPRMIEMLGVQTANDLVGKPFSPLYPEEHRQKLDDEIMPLLLVTGSWTGELALTKADGSIFPTLENFFLLNDDEGNPKLLVDIVTDISDRRAQEQTTIKRAAELATVADIGTTISSVLEEESLLETVVQLTRERFDLYHSHIFLADEDNQTLQVKACGWEADSPHVGTHRDTIIHITQEQSLVAQAARHQHAVIVNDVREDPTWQVNELLPATRSEMAIPLIAGDQVLGVLDVQADEVNRFTDEDISIMTTLTSQVAIALQNARTYAKTQQQANQEATINLISQRIQSTTSVENALQVAIRELGRALGAKRTNVQLGLSNPQEKIKSGNGFHPGKNLGK